MPAAKKTVQKKQTGTKTGTKNETNVKLQKKPVVEAKPVVETKPEPEPEPVVEASSGVDRALLTVLADAFTQEEVNGDKRTVLKLSPRIAPIKVAVFPLFNKNNMPEISQKISSPLPA